MTGPTMAGISGLALGALSSAHCLAMCGPLVLVVGRRSGAASRGAQARHALLYHAGRLLAYVTLALPAGLFGRTMIANDFGRALAIGSGAVMLMAAVGVSRVRLFGRLSSGLAMMIARASWLVQHRIGGNPVSGPLLAGALNGLLPCGLVYAAVTVAAATGSLAAAAALMVGFALGTTPALVAMSMAAASISTPWRLRLRQAGPLLLALTAVLLIARGIAAPHQHGGSPHAAVAHDHAGMGR